MKLLLIICFWGGSVIFAAADETRVAVAANFTQAAKEIGRAFELSTGHKVQFSFGSTGQLYTQISQYAPFDIFLAADQTRIEKAIDEGFAVAQSQITYAIGKIALYSANKNLVVGADTLKQNNFTKIAIANPTTAPYGAAAMDVMEKLGVYQKLKNKIVKGNNIAQTFQFVKTENAEIGFISLSQIIQNDEGSRWIVPKELYSPISQDAVLLKTGEKNNAAMYFIEFLQQPIAKKIIEEYGYGIHE